MTIAAETRGTCTVFRITGEVTADEIVSQALQFMSGEQTDTSLWDFSQATRIKMSTPEIKGIADRLKVVSPEGNSHKVALVGSSTVNIGLGKLYAAFAQMVGLPYTYKVFRNLDLAEDWLRNGD